MNLGRILECIVIYLEGNWGDSPAEWDVETLNVLWLIVGQPVLFRAADEVISEKCGHGDR